MIDRRWLAFALISLVLGSLGMILATLPLLGITYSDYFIGLIIPAPPLFIIGIILTCLEIRDRNKPDDMITGKESE